MFKATERNTTLDAVQPSRSALAYSPKIAAAFAVWQIADVAFKAASAAEPAAYARYAAMLPERSEWFSPLNSDQIAACEAAKETSGVFAAEAASQVAHDAAHEMLMRFMAVQPETMADVVLQAKCLKEWLHDFNLALPAEIWLSTVTGEEWPDHILK